MAVSLRQTIDGLLRRAYAVVLERLEREEERLAGEALMGNAVDGLWNAWDEAERNPGVWVGPFVLPDVVYTPFHEVGETAVERGGRRDGLAVLRELGRSAAEAGVGLQAFAPNYREMRREILAAEQATRELRSIEPHTAEEERDWGEATMAAQTTESHGMTLEDLLGDDVTDLIGEYRKFREEIGE